MFDGFQLLGSDSVLITNEEGVVEEIVPNSEAGDDVQFFEGILSPGFINCHCHLELSHMKGMIAEKTGLVRFVLDVVQLRHFPDEQILEAIEKAEDEMLYDGIVAAGDICNNVLSLPQKAKGRMYYHNFIEASGYNPQIVSQRFRRSLEFFREYARYYSIPVESNSIVPHAPYSVADELWELIIHFPGNHLFTIHNQETRDENEWFMNKTGGFTELYKEMKIDVTWVKPSGKSSLQTFLPKFLRNQQVILVHNVHTSEKDLLSTSGRTASGSKLFWCLCPNANLYITGDLPDADMLVKHHCDIVLGTDSLASNHQLSILEEVKTMRKHFPDIQIEELLKWATSNGARALQIESVLGSFEKGKKPGILKIETELSGTQRLL